MEGRQAGKRIFHIYLLIRRFDRSVLVVVKAGLVKVASWDAGGVSISGGIGGAFSQESGNDLRVV